MSEENEELLDPGDHIEIEEISGGTAAVGQGAQAVGTLIEKLEKTHIAGDYVARQEITNTILVVGPEGLEKISEWLAQHQGLDDKVVKQPGTLVPPAQVDQQIGEVLAAEKETAANGIQPSPQAAYNLGMLAAYRRDYDAALSYFAAAAAADPEFSDAFESTAWLQQSLAMEDLKRQDVEKAAARLSAARTAAEKTDPLDSSALALRGYIAKTLAQIAEAQEDSPAAQKYYAEAGRVFEHIVKLEPNNAAAYNGLANVQYGAGDFDGAIASSERAISLIPDYTAAYHDLALAYEAKWRNEPVGWEKWCVRALNAWREAYRLAPGDPSFTAEKILQIGRRIQDLEKYC